MLAAAGTCLRGSGSLQQSKDVPAAGGETGEAPVGARLSFCLHSLRQASRGPVVTIVSFTEPPGWRNCPQPGDASTCRSPERPGGSGWAHPRPTQRGATRQGCSPRSPSPPPGHGKEPTGVWKAAGLRPSEETGSRGQSPGVFCLLLNPQRLAHPWNRVGSRNTCAMNERITKQRSRNHD